MKPHIHFSLLALALLVFCNGAGAQQKQALTPWHFKSFNTAGLVLGHSGNSLQVVSVNGVQHGQWFAGIGTGLDLYLRRSIPVYLEVNKTLGNNFFVYTAGGVNYYWNQNTDAKQFYYNDKFKAGFYGEAGVGYTVNLHRKLALLFCGAYSFKKLTEEGYNFYDTGFPTAPAPNEKISYNLSRIVLKTGIAF